MATAFETFEAVRARFFLRNPMYPPDFLTEESPLSSEIEKILAVQLLDLFCPVTRIDTALAWHRHPRGIPIDEARKDFSDWINDSMCWRRFGPRTRAVIFPQVLIGSIRVDFLVCARECINPDTWKDASVVVECDGHDFHERTKQQAARDRQRDRSLTAAGIPFLRFTGSEIFHDSFRCLVEIENLLWRALHGTDCPLREFDEEDEP